MLHIQFLFIFIPNYWKIARVSPVFKESDKADCFTYRAISVSPVIRSTTSMLSWGGGVKGSCPAILDFALPKVASITWQ